MKTLETKALFLFIMLVEHAYTETFNEIYDRQKNNAWFKDGVDLLNEKLNLEKIENKAKGVIIFIGDGMGISTVTAGRVLAGQLKGQTGEENVLNWEITKEFPNVGLSKTYNTDMQTADSAGTATAFMTGVKTRSGVVSVNENVERTNCSSSENNRVLSIIMMAEKAGLSTGVVTTARLTHATPSVTYAHAAERDWEANVDLPNSKCKDIASQLIDFPYGDGLEIAFGGGRKNFLPDNVRDNKDNNKFGVRKDRRHLINEWIQKSPKHVFVWDKTGFDNLSINHASHILGLFNYNHMQYSYEQSNDTAGEPSLTEMVDLAVRKLQQNEKGYVLLVEAGRIDHGHHSAKAFQALHDVVELNRAVGKAVSLTDPRETLLIVTADHSHVFTFGGYQTRGTDIFTYTNQNKHIAKDGFKFTSLGYFNGPGAPLNTNRSEPLKEGLKDPNYQWQSLVPLDSETHGAEDVGIYARGTQAHLIGGVVEQNYIFHVMDYALCLSESKKKICQEQQQKKARKSSAKSFRASRSLYLMIVGLMVKVMM